MSTPFIAMRAGHSAVHLRREEELIHAVDYLHFVKECAEEEYFAAVRELETFRAEHVPPVPADANPF